MIGRLRGILISKQPPQLLIDVHGVGYEVDAPMSTFYQLPDIDQELTLLTHLVVREDAQLLYGFATEAERNFFRSLIKVNGVGAKLALAILSGMSAEEFARCVHADDTSSLTKLPGVGKKTAERLIVEMRDRLKDWHSNLPEQGSQPQPSADIRVDAIQEAVTALISLGYRPPEASKMVAALGSQEGLSSEEIIRAALKASIS